MEPDLSSALLVVFSIAGKKSFWFNTEVNRLPEGPKSILGFVAIVFLTTTTLHHCNQKAATDDNINEWAFLCSNKTLKVIDQIWPRGSLPTLDLTH